VVHCPQSPTAVAPTTSAQTLLKSAGRVTFVVFTPPPLSLELHCSLLECFTFVLSLKSWYFSYHWMLTWKGYLINVSHSTLQTSSYIVVKYVIFIFSTRGRQICRGMTEALRSRWSSGI